MIDATDSRILAILQEDARIANAEIARRVGMAPSAVFERIRKLEASGIIEGYSARLSPKMLDMGLLAFVFVRSERLDCTREMEAQIATIPEVQELHHVAGEDCFIAKIRVADTDHLDHILRDQFGAIPHIRMTRTTIVLATAKETGHLPIDGAPDK